LFPEPRFADTWTIEFVHGLLTDDDKPAFLLDQASKDLSVLHKASRVMADWAAVTAVLKQACKR
jgi:hypothetical protein